MKPITDMYPLNKKPYSVVAIREAQYFKKGECIGRFKNMEEAKRAATFLIERDMVEIQYNGARIEL